MTRTNVLYALAFAALLLGACLLYVYKGQSTPPLETVESNEIQFEIADTPEAREKGLSWRTNLGDNYAMLFVFDTEDSYGIWMKDMLTPIDIIWLDEDGTILGINESVAVSSYPDVFYPPEPVRFVLEMSAGNARSRGWEIGTKVELPQ